MSRYIDAEWLLNFFEPYPNDYQTPLGSLRACVDDAPSIELIRCGECKYASHWRTLGICAVTNQRVKADDFCSYGERNAGSNTFNTLDALDDNSSEKPNNSERSSE